VVKPTIPERHSDLMANAAIGTTPHTNSLAMKEKDEATPKKENTDQKEDTTKQENSDQKEDTAEKEASDQKEDTAKQENPDQKEDTAKKEASAAKPHFSEKKINEIVQRIREKVAEHRRLQKEGILPYRKQVPITVMEIPYVMVVINRKRTVASLLMKEIREYYGKRPRQKVSVTEFSKYTGIPIEDVRDALYNLT
jgi:phage I-like protein